MFKRSVEALPGTEYRPHESPMQAASFIETIEERQDLKVTCVEKIAYRMGYITSDQLEKLAIPFGKSGYDKYLQDLLTYESHSPNIQ